MTTIEILKLASKIATAKDGGLSVIAEMLKDKNVKTMVLYLDKDNKGAIRTFEFNLIEQLVEQSELINELSNKLLNK